jgi:hypothetical protein
MTLQDVPVKQGIEITQLGDTNELGAKVQANEMRIVLRAHLKGDYSYSFKLANYLR